MAKGFCFWTSMVCGVVVFIVLVILLITSFVYVEYDEYAFKKSTVTNRVDQSQAYGAGRYVWGFEHTKIVFPALYQLVELNLSVSNEDGVSLGLEISFWYKFRQNELSKTYQKYGLNYATQISSIARGVVRNTAGVFDVNQFISQRSEITAVMAKNLSNALSQQVFIDVPEYAVQMNSVKFSESILSKHLLSAIRLEENEKKEYEQKAQLTRQETEKLVQQYNANTTIITRTAEAGKLAKIESARAKYEEIIGKARGVGIGTAIRGLGMDKYNETVSDTFVQLMSILDNNQTQIVNLDSNAIINLNKI
eukprot:83060_1